MTSHRIRIRNAGRCAGNLRHGCELAEYEKAAHEVQSNEELFTEALFCDEPAVWCCILEHHPQDAASDEMTVG